MLGVAVTLFGLAMNAIFCATIPTELRLAFVSERVEGQILSVEEGANVRIQRRKAGEIHYEYRHQGQTYQDSVFTLRPFSAGQTVTVELLPGEPAVSRLEGTTRGFFGYMGSFTFLFTLSGLGFLFAARRRAARLRALLQHGRPTQGRLVSLGAPGTAASGARNALQRPWVLRWERDEEGKTYHGEVSLGATDAPAERTPGSPLVILVDPRDPGRGAPYLG